MVPQNTDVTQHHGRVEILDFRSLATRHVRAICRVRVGPILIDGVKIIQPTLGQPFVAMPQRNDNGEWRAIVTVLSPSLEAEIAKTVMAAWREVGLFGGAK